MRRFVAALAVASAWGLASAQAMQFSTESSSDGQSVRLWMRGEIEHGDADRFRAFLNRVGRNRISNIRLDSVGGYITEAADMADEIAVMQRPTYVQDKNVCASACFFLFSAGNYRIVDVTARIGVHGASGLPDSDKMTVIMARAMKKIGRIPDSVIVKMVTTPSSDISWLGRNDYAAMGVTVVGYNQNVRIYADRPPEFISQQQAATAPSYIPPIVPHHELTAPTPTNPFPSRENRAELPAGEQSQAFHDGVQDRLALEQWVNGFGKGTDAYNGAQYWAMVRNTAQAREGCLFPDKTSEWQNGCYKASVKLAPMDIRRRAEPDYKAGWNDESARLGG
jgi:hypothetical protein